MKIHITNTYALAAGNFSRENGDRRAVIGYLQCGLTLQRLLKDFEPIILRPIFYEDGLQVMFPKLEVLVNKIEGDTAEDHMKKYDIVLRELKKIRSLLLIEEAKLEAKAEWFRFK